MQLILWRHAEAEDAAAGTGDAERRLTPKGKKQAQAIAKWLRPRLPGNVRILASPAKRARQTAEALDLPFEVAPEIAVGADAGDLVAAAGWPEAGGTVLLVGHQPTLGQLAALLLSGSEADWAIKKSGLWWFSKRGGVPAMLRTVVDPGTL